MNNVSVENINNLVGSLYNPIREVNRDVKSISLAGGDPILPDENKNINIPSYDGNPGLFNKGIYNELVGKIPTKLSELQNDNNYVQDNSYVHTDNNFTTSYKDKLEDTYRKSEVYNKQESYNKSEIDNKIASIVTTTFEVVDELPEQGESNVIYLVPNEQSADNEYEEYIWVNNKWELIGTTKVDLTPYYTSSQVDDLINPISDSVTSLQQNKLDKNLGADNANKHLGIDSSGNILPVNDVITTSELTSALQEEQKAREKQDELLQGEIDTKMAPSNIIAGDNVNVSQQGLDVTVSATVPKYTAGTNMEITEDNVINNTIPYNPEGTGASSLAIGEGSYAMSSSSVAIGKEARIGDSYDNAVAIGRYASTGSYGVAIGTRCDPANGLAPIAIGYYTDYSTNSAHGSIIIGSHNIEDKYNIHNASIVIGTNAKSVGYNTAVFGSTSCPINNMYYISSEGQKTVATTDQIPEETPIATTELVGKVKPDGTSTTIDEDGTLHSVGVTQEYVDNAVSQLQTKITELESRIEALENANA